MKQIVWAMHNYAANNSGRLPAAVGRDGSGKPLYSWRVLLLPYLDEDSLYREFHLKEPWDSTHNLALLPRMPKVYGLPPSLPVAAKAEPGSTFYEVFVGKRTAFTGSEGVLLETGIPDGTSNTILVVEAGEAVPWTKPVDLEYDDDQPIPPLGGVFTGESRFSLFGSNRVKGFHVGMADGSIRFITPSTTEATLRNAIRRDDGQVLGMDW